jgi:hypothetical protein
VKGAIYNGTVKLAGDFPPSVNTTDDITALKPFESPACYGVDCQRDGQLKTGSILTGTARVATTKTISATTYYWHYDRCWRSSGADLIFGAPFYDDVYQVQGRGKVTAEASIVAFMPCFNTRMWVATASGSQFVDNAMSQGSASSGGVMRLGQLVQELTLSTGHGTSALTLDEIPYLVNTKGIWSYDGQNVKEWTRPVRYTLGSFGSEVALTADYQQKFIIGAAKFVLDPLTGKLFDYGTSGFLFTSRTLVADGYRPFGIGDLFFSVQFSPDDPSDATINWETKTEDSDWTTEEDIVVQSVDGMKTMVVARPQNSITTAHKFAIRITGLSSNLYIRQIDIDVAGFAHGDFGE